MKKNSITYSCVFFILFSMFHVLQVHSAESKTISSASNKYPPEKSSQSLKADSRRLKSKILKISSSIKLKENQRTKLQKKIFSFDKEIEELSLKQHKLVNEQSEIQARLAGLAHEKSVLEAEIASSNDAMSQLIRAFYLLKTNTPAKLLINQENIGVTGRMKVYHEYLIQDYIKQYQLLIKQKESYANLNKTLSNKLSVLEKLEGKVRSQASVLQKSYDKRSTTLAKLDSRIKSDRTKVKRLKSDHKRLEKLAQAISKLALKSKQTKSSGMSFAKHKGGLSWPVKGRVVKKYGRTRAGSRLKWRGILIETNAGASVTSVADGRVVFSDWLSGYGFVLIIEHGRGYMSLYAHNQQLLLNVGDQVRENQLIALAGSSGRSGKPGLYFEIRHKGKPINPGKWIIARNSRK